MSLLFVSGMFRSGTTTFARALNAHPALAVASDPFAELLKAFRSEVAATIDQDVPVMAPLADYYFDPAGQALLEKLRCTADLDRLFTVWDRERLLARLRPRCEAYAGALASRVDEMQGHSYRAMLESLLHEVRNVYGDNNTEITGFKEVWATESIPALARTFPDARFIVFTRDPRSVSASKNTHEDKYPWLFLARQWRKLAALGYAFSHEPCLEDRVLNIRYEDFITEPETTTRAVCKFLDVSWHPDIADPTAYKNGSGQAWVQNTSYGKGKAGFDTRGLDRWRKVLSRREVELIELVCGPEMGLYGYEKCYPPVLPDGQMLVDAPRIDDHQKAAWMRGQVPNDPVTSSVQMAEETVRATLLHGEALSDNADAEELISAAFLSKTMYQAVRSRLL